MVTPFRNQPKNSDSDWSVDSDLNLIERLEEIRCAVAACIAEPEQFEPQPAESHSIAEKSNPAIGIDPRFQSLQFRILRKGCQSHVLNQISIQGSDS
jgi:hypothetical protein